jgi:hypothetical protein
MAGLTGEFLNALADELAGWAKELAAISPMNKFDV